MVTGLPDDELALRRHATVRLNQADLFRIRTLGFRGGPALYRILLGVLTLLTAVSRCQSRDQASGSWGEVEKSFLRPVLGTKGLC